MHKQYLKMIIENGKQEDMEELGHLFNKAMDHLKDCDKELYDKIECKMYEMIYGEKLSLEMAEDWVKNMQPMAKWTKEEIDGVISTYNLDVDGIDFYVTMNMMYSDYSKDIEENLDEYIKMSLDFLNDVDAQPNKLYRYYKYIVKKD